MNQLIEVKKGTSVQNATMVATFGYDPIGRRILKATPTKTVAYTYDGADVLRENVTTSGSTVTSYYVHGPGIDEPLSKETGLGGHPKSGHQWTPQNRPPRERPGRVHLGLTDYRSRPTVAIQAQE